MNRQMGWAAIAFAMMPLSGALAQTTSTDTAELQKRLDEQEQRLKVLERKLEIQEETNAAAAATAATIKASPAGFSMQSPDGRNVIKLRGNFQLDGRYFSDNSTPNSADTWLLRRVRPYIEGTLNGIYDFRIMPDFAGGKSIVLDAYVAGRFKSWAVLQAGKFKGPVGLERLQPDQYTRFIELGFPSSLVPNRDIGLQFGGAVFKNALSYQVGYFDGVVDGSSTDSNPTADTTNTGRRDWEGRVFAQPFVNSNHFYLRGLGIGAGGSFVNITGSPTNPLLPTYRTPGQQTFFTYTAPVIAGLPTTVNSAPYADGKRVRWTPQAYYYIGSLGVITEYVQATQEISRHISATTTRSGSVDNSAWQVAASFFLTGEEATYASFTPNTTFNMGKPGWGAWEILARYQELDLDPDAFYTGTFSFANTATQPRRAAATGIGVNWYLNQNVKWQLNYERTKFAGGAAAGRNRSDERAFLTRFALVF